MGLTQQFHEVFPVVSQTRESPVASVPVRLFAADAPNAVY